MRLRGLIVLAACSGALAACGGDFPQTDSVPAPSVGNPAVAKTTPKRSDGRLNEAVPAEQVAASAARSNAPPCSLVSRSQASAIVGERVRAVEAAQGPTCVYQGETSFVTVSVQTLDFAKLKPKLGVPKRVEIADRGGYCGNYGQQMLYVPLAKGSVLVVAAPCPQAKRFASTALQTLIS